MSRTIRLRPRVVTSIPAPAAGAMLHMIIHHTQFGKTPSSADADWLYGAPYYRNRIQMSGDKTTMKSRDAGQCIYMPYALLWSCFSDTQPNTGYNTDWRYTAESWADANGYNREDLFVHAAAGTNNSQAVILSIDAAGLVTLGKNSGGWQYTSKGYSAGQTITIANTGSYDGTHTISSVPSNTTIQLADVAAATGTGILYIPGDGSLTLGNRRQLFYFNQWRFLLNPFSAGGIAWAIYKHGLSLTNGTNEAVFYDECSRVDISAGTYLVEGSSAAWGAAIQGLLSQFRTSYPGTVSFPNTSAYITATDAATADAAGGCLCESLFYPVGYDPDGGISFMQARIAKGVKIIAGCVASFDGAATQAGVYNVPSNMRTAGGHLYPSPDVRMMMLNYGTFMIRINDGAVNAAIVVAAGNWDSNIQAKWFPFFEYFVGYPVADGVLVIDNNSAADSGSVKLWQRAYSTDGVNNDVLFIAYRGRYGSEPKPYDASTEITYTLPAPPAGKQWHMLQWDKTLGPVITTIKLWAAEAAVMIAI